MKDLFVINTTDIDESQMVQFLLSRQKGVNPDKYLLVSYKSNNDLFYRINSASVFTNKYDGIVGINHISECDVSDLLECIYSADFDKTDVVLFVKSSYVRKMIFELLDKDVVKEINL